MADLGRLDADGWWYIVDRQKDRIEKDGIPVGCREIEAGLAMHPAVAFVMRRGASA